MADMIHVKLKVEEQLREITECQICMNAFTDPRTLPCIHTFCFQCLKRTSEKTQKKPGDKMPCPFCRKEFLIPKDGVNGVQKNVFIENLLESTTTRLQIHCCQCKIRNKGKDIPKATESCLECKDYFCGSCSKKHQQQKRSKNHHLVKIRPEVKEETRRISAVDFCTNHGGEPLDYYCTDCMKFACMFCSMDDHRAHDCKYVKEDDEKFRRKIEENASKISNYTVDMLLLRKNKEAVNLDFVKKMVEKENAIRERSEELKAMIDKHTKSLLDELSSIKTKHLKEIENELIGIHRCCIMLTNFEAYCTELVSKGSVRDISSSVDQLLARADDLEGEYEAFIRLQYLPLEVSFQTTDLTEVLHKSNNNVVGKIQEFENYAVVMGINDATEVFSKYYNDEAIMINDVIKINIGGLHQPNRLPTQEQIPTTMAPEAFAAVHRNTMYVTGIGDKKDEIWKYNTVSGWMKCASLVQSRRGHSAAFIDEVLYIFGGFVLLDESVLDSVEAYNAFTDKCSTVGKLVHGVHSSGNCVPFKSSLYIFGGVDKFGCPYAGDDEKDENDHVTHVQVYNPKQNTCTLLSKPMPRKYRLMRAVLWETSVILLGRYTCYIFNFETESWQERKQFKTDVHHFGLVLDNERIFVIGGGIEGFYHGDGETYHGDGETWNCRDDVRYVPLQNILENKPTEWKIHGKLPQRSLIHAYEKLSC